MADQAGAAARATAVLEELAPLGGEEARAGMARYGITVENAFGVSVYELRRVAKGLGRDHELALALWATGNHEARLLASMVDDPAQVTEEQMDSWAAQFDSWDVCDQVTSNLFDKTPFAYDKVQGVERRDEDQWIKRAGFRDRGRAGRAGQEGGRRRFLEFLESIEREAGDERNFVKKAVNWAAAQHRQAGPAAERGRDRHGRGRPGRGRGAGRCGPQGPARRAAGAGSPRRAARAAQRQGDRAGAPARVSRGRARARRFSRRRPWRSRAPGSNVQLRRSVPSLRAMGGRLPVTHTNTSFDAIERRHPTALRGITWLRSHPVLCGTAGTIGMAAVFFLDMSFPGYLLNGLYFIPLFFLAIAVNWRAVAFAVAVAVGLSAFVFLWEGSLDVDRWLILIYSVLIGGALVMLSYLIKRLSTTIEYATLRAQLSEAGADILGSGRSVDDLDELLEYALERMGEQLDATHGVLLLLEGGEWQGRAGFGLGVDARQVSAPYSDVPLAAQALRADAGLSRDFANGDPAPLAPLAAHVRLERTLVIPMRSLEREVGVLIFNRPQDMGEFSGEQLALAEGLARYIGVTVDNVRLLFELNTRRRDLELVRDSSLDFAQSIDMDEVLEAVVTRLIGALDMHACDIYEVDLEAGVMRNLVSYDDGGFDAAELAGSGVSHRLLRHQRHGHPQPQARRGHLHRRSAAQLRGARPHEALGSQHRAQHPAAHPRARDRPGGAARRPRGKATSRTRRSSWRAASAGSPRWRSTRRGSSTSSAPPPSGATAWRDACSACSRSPSSSTSGSTAPTCRRCSTRSPGPPSTCCTCARRRS